MRKVILIILSFVLLVSPQAALAQTASPSSVKVTPTATTSGTLAKSLTTLLTRLEAHLVRLDKIAQRINSRLSKLNLVDPQQKTLTEKLTKSKTDLSALNAQSKTLVINMSTKQDYLLFKNQVMTFNKNLRDIYKLELDLVANMKKQAVATATPTTVAVPTK